MKVILLGDIKDVGKAFELKNVSDGYARNYLFPRKLAKLADSKTIQELEIKKAAFKKQEEELTANLEKIAHKIKDKEIEFQMKTGEKKEVFGSITKEDIKAALVKEAGDLSEEDIKILIDKPIKTLGEHPVSVDLGKGVKTEIKVKLLE